MNSQLGKCLEIFCKGERSETTERDHPEQTKASCMQLNEKVQSIQTREHPQREEHSYMMIRFKATTLSAKRLSANDVSIEI